MVAYAGELAGAAAAVTWAVGSLIFSRAPAPAGALNLFKSTFASVLLWSILGANAIAAGGPMTRVSWPSATVLCVSGFIGITIGDTLYYRSLQILGPRRALVLTTITPPLAAALGWSLLGERLKLEAWFGMAVTLLGVAWVMRERGAGAESPRFYPGSIGAGIACGFFAALCQAGGAILSKIGMREVDALEASAVRLLAAAAFVFLYAAATGKLGVWRARLFAPGMPVRLAAGTACGTCLGIWLSLVSYRYTKVAIATTLTSLTPIFIMPLERLVLGHRASPRAILGALVAVAGIAILFLDEFAAALGLQ